MKRDANYITTDAGGFTQSGTFIAPGGIEATVDVIHTKHHLKFDLQTAQEINSMKAHVVVSEQELIALNYPVRSENKVSLQEHKFRAADDRGEMWTYDILQWFPNEKVGTISIILGSRVQ
jgi:hypothetical protein